MNPDNKMKLTKISNHDEHSIRIVFRFRDDFGRISVMELAAYHFLLVAISSSKSCYLLMSGVNAMEMRLELNRTGFNHFDLQKGEADELHTHDHYQLSIPLTGTITAYHNYQVNKLDYHGGLLVPPGDVHQHEAMDDRKEILLVSAYEDLLQNVFMLQTGKSLPSIDFAPQQVKSKTKLISLVKKMYQTAALEDFHAAVEMEEEFAALFLDELKGSHSEAWERSRNVQQFDEHPIVAKIADYIHTQYKHSISLDDMARDLHISKFHLHRSFTNAKNCTPMEYLHKVRLDQAKLLLLTTSFDITSIAYEVGYRSVSTFNRAFKKCYLVTPTELRRRI